MDWISLWIVDYRLSTSVITFQVNTTSFNRLLIKFRSSAAHPFTIDSPHWSFKISRYQNPKLELLSGLTLFVEYFKLKNDRKAENILFAACGILFYETNYFHFNLCASKPKASVLLWDPHMSSEKFPFGYFTLTALAVFTAAAAPRCRAFPAREWSKCDAGWKGPLILKGPSWSVGFQGFWLISSCQLEVGLAGPGAGYE